MRQIILIIACFLLEAGISFSQNIDFVKKTVDTLSSKTMYGRGYLNNGLDKAANYISTEFSNIGLKAFHNSYFQELSYPINTFPNVPIVSSEKMQFKCGTDYIIQPYSSGKKGIYKTVVFNKKTFSTQKRFNKFLSSDLRNKAVIIDNLGVTDEGTKKIFTEMQVNPFHAPVLVFINDKSLMWGASTDTSGYLGITLNRNVWNKKCKKLTIEVKNTFIADFKTKNIIGFIPGKLFPDSFIVITAHYDHLGGIGDSCYFPGAHDNASGIAMMLDLAKYYSKAENQPNISYVFVAFTGEEAGLIGSRFLTEHPLFNLKKIRFLLNLDIIGTGKDGITVVNGDLFPKELQILKKVNEVNSLVSNVASRGKAMNSDHYYFSEEGVHSFFIYTRGEALPYHNINDTKEKIPYTAYDGLFKLITRFLIELK